MRRPAQIMLHRPLVSHIFISPDESEMTDHDNAMLRMSSADDMIIVDIVFCLCRQICHRNRSIPLL